MPTRVFQQKPRKFAKKHEHRLTNMKLVKRNIHLSQSLAHLFKNVYDLRAKNAKKC